MNKFKLITLFVGLLLAIAFTISCSPDDGDGGLDETGASSSSSDDTVSSSSSSDDSQPSSSSETTFSFETVKIGEQVWMKKNLDIVPTGDNGAATNYVCLGGVEQGNVFLENIEDEPPGDFSVDNVYDFFTKDYITLTQQEIDENCEKYGRLYDFATAMAMPEKCNYIWNGYDPDCTRDTDGKHQGICPDGFHIPTNYDWSELFRFVDKDNGIPPFTEEGYIYKSEIAGRKLKSNEGWNNCGTVDSGNDYICEDAYGFSALPGGYRKGRYFYNNGAYWLGCGGVEMESSNNTMGWHIKYNEEYAHWDNADKDGRYSVRCVKD